MGGGGAFDPHWLLCSRQRCWPPYSSESCDLSPRPLAEKGQENGPAQRGHATFDPILSSDWLLDLSPLTPPPPSEHCM